MNRTEQISLVARLFQLEVEDVERNSSWIDDMSDLYFSEPIMEGRSMIAAPDGSVLFADSSISYDEHIREFKKGTRTPLSDFETNMKGEKAP